MRDHAREKIKSRRFVFVVVVVLRHERKRKTGAKHYESRTGARAVGQSPSLCVSVVVSLRAKRRLFCRPPS